MPSFTWIAALGVICGAATAEPPTLARRIVSVESAMLTETMNGALNPDLPSSNLDILTKKHALLLDQRTGHDNSRSELVTYKTQASLLRFENEAHAVVVNRAQEGVAATKESLGVAKALVEFSKHEAKVASNDSAWAQKIGNSTSQALADQAGVMANTCTKAAKAFALAAEDWDGDSNDKIADETKVSALVAKYAASAAAQYTELSKATEAGTQTLPKISTGIEELLQQLVDGASAKAVANVHAETIAKQAPSQQRIPMFLQLESVPAQSKATSKVFHSSEEERIRAIAREVHDEDHASAFQPHQEDAIRTIARDEHRKLHSDAAPTAQTTTAAVVTTAVATTSESPATTAELTTNLEPTTSALPTTTTTTTSTDFVVNEDSDDTADVIITRKPKTTSTISVIPKATVTEVPDVFETFPTFAPSETTPTTEEGLDATTVATTTAIPESAYVKAEKHLMEVAGQEFANNFSWNDLLKLAQERGVAEELVAHFLNAQNASLAAVLLTKKNREAILNIKAHGTKAALASKSFADKAAAAGQNALALILEMRNQFDLNTAEALAKAQALAKAYNVKRTMRDRLAHEHAQESIMLRQIREQAYKAAETNANMATTIRESATGFAASRSEKSAHAVATLKKAAEAAVGLETGAVASVAKVASQVEQCKFQMLTKKAFVEKMNVVTQSNIANAALVDTLSVLKGAVDAISEQRARKPDLPVADDLSVVRPWSEARIQPLIAQLKAEFANAGELWNTIQAANSTSTKQQEAVHKKFSLIQHRLFADSTYLMPHKLAQCCTDAPMFIQLKAQMRSHLRGKDKQATLVADPAPAADVLVAATVIANQLDTAINTEIATQLTSLDKSVKATAAHVATLPRLVDAGKGALEALRVGLTNITDTQTAAVVREVNSITSDVDKKTTLESMAHLKNHCEFLRIDETGRAAMNKRAATLMVKATTQFFQDAVARHELSLKQASLLNAYVTCPRPDQVHMELLRIAESRSLYILNVTGVEHEISETHASNIKHQLDAAVDQTKIQQKQVEEWLRVLSLAEQDAKDANGGKRMHNYTSGLLVVRSEALASLDAAYKQVANVSREILGALDKKYTAETQERLAKMSSIGAQAEAAHVEHQTLQTKVGMKKLVASDLRSHIERLTNEIATLHTETEEVSNSSRPDFEIKQEIKDKTATVTSLQAKLAKETEDIDAGTAALEAAAGKSEKADDHIAVYTAWKKKVDAALKGVKTMLAAEMKTIQLSTLSYAQPPSPNKLSKLINGTVPKSYVDAYDLVDHASKVVDATTQQLRFASMLTSKLANAKAYSDSVPVEMKIKQILNMLEKRSQPKQAQISEDMGAVAAGLDALAARLTSVLRGEIAASYLHEIAELTTTDGVLSADIPTLLHAANSTQAAAEGASSREKALRKKLTQVSTQAQDAYEHLMALLTNTTGRLSTLQGQLDGIAEEKNATIASIVTWNLTLTRELEKLNATQEHAAGTQADITELTLTIESMKDVLLSLKETAKQRCETSAQLTKKYNSLTTDQLYLMDLNQTVLEEATQKCTAAFRAAKAQQDGIDKATPSLTRAQAKYASIQTDIMDMRSLISNHTAHLGELRAQLSQLASTQAQLSASLAEAHRQVGRLQPTIDMAKSAFESLNTTRAGLLEEVNSAANLTETSSLAAAEALSSAQVQVQSHHARVAQLKILQQNYSSFGYMYRNDTLYQQVADEAKTTVKTVGHLVQTIGDLRGLETSASHAVLGIVKELANGFVEAFKTVGGQIDTKQVQENAAEKSVDAVVDESVDKTIAVGLYREALKLDSAFVDADLPKETSTWGSVGEHLHPLTNVTNLKDSLPSPPTGTTNPPTTTAASTTTPEAVSTTTTTPPLLEVNVSSDLKEAHVRAGNLTAEANLRFAEKSQELMLLEMESELTSKVFSFQGPFSKTAAEQLCIQNEAHLCSHKELAAAYLHNHPGNCLCGWTSTSSGKGTFLVEAVSSNGDLTTAAIPAVWSTATYTGTCELGLTVCSSDQPSAPGYGPSDSVKGWPAHCCTSSA